MSNIESFFWYDLETFGLNPFYDRIAQFAGQRTDVNLNPIGDPVILYCRLSADYLPDPAACLVTGITPQIVKEKGIPESEFIETINRLFSQRGTCVCGFNTMKFDDEFIRNALYRNLMDPYEREWKNFCSRWDIIDLVRACHDFRPEGINWPNPSDKGNPVFKLTSMTAANNIEQIGAHDAMVDVNATIAVAKLIKQKQPKLFDHYLKLRSKIEVKNYLKLDELPVPVLHTNAAFTSPFGCTRMIVPLSAKVDQDNSIFCFDLSQDPSLLISAKDEDVFNTPGLFKIALNKSPFIAPLKSLSAKDYERLGINYSLCYSHYETIMRNRTDLVVKLRETKQLEFPTAEDPDFAIYTKFFSDYDKNLFYVVRKTPPEQRLSLNLKFQDPRCDKMLWRHVCRNYPQVLDEKQTTEYKQFAANRILCPPGNPINDVYFVERKIEEKLNDSSYNDKERSVLKDLRNYVVALRRYLGLEDKKIV